MIDKKQIEILLRVNGVPPTAQDEEIRSVLVSARWHHGEVDTALMVLKENTVSHQTRVDTLHKIFRTNDRLNAAEIAALLGITVDVSEEVYHAQEERIRSQRVQSIVAFILSIIIAASSLGYVMYREGVGVFHPTASLQLNKN